jgi:hypothetical protein
MNSDVSYPVPSLDNTSGVVFATCQESRKMMICDSIGQAFLIDVNFFEFIHLNSN